MAREIPFSGDVDRAGLPKHVAIIMDGNRRWARLRGLPPMAGHFRGAEALVEIVRAAQSLSIEVLTVFAFSTENWKRSSIEVKALMRLFKIYLGKQKNSMIEHGVRLSTIGDISRLPTDVRYVLDKTVEETAMGTRLNLVIAFNYGGRDEICRAIKKIMDNALEKKIAPEDLTEEVISSYLDTAKWKDPDLVIRTSGENRMSNFLLWQSSYAQMVVDEVLWPDFSEKNLWKAVLEYQKRELRLGK